MLLNWGLTMKRILCIGLFVTLCGFAEASSDAPQMLQIKQSFEPMNLTVTASGSLDFVNMDDVNHNIQVIDSKGVRTDLGVEKPGDTTHFSFSGPGAYSIICGIHPRMKAKVTVQ